MTESVTKDVKPKKAESKPTTKDSTVEMSSKAKTLNNTDVNGAKNNVSDLAVFGNGDLFQLISKASSQKEGWMKSTKAMAITGVGVVIQVTTQQGNEIAEALTFVPGTKIVGESGSRLIVKA